MSSRWLNESNLSPFFICCAGAWQGQAGRGGGGVTLGDTGEKGQPWGRSICSPNHPVSSSNPHPVRLDLFWVRKRHKILVREHGRAAEHPWVPPPWPCRGATCTSPATSRTWKTQTRVTPRLLSLYSGSVGSGKGWFGVVSFHTLPVKP